MTEFDRVPARRALRLMQLAAERWHAQYATMTGQPIRDDEHRNEVSALLSGYAVELLTWARGLDDWCLGKGSCDALPGYREARESVRGLLEGARYVTNHAVHQLADFSKVVTGFTFPLTFPWKFDKLAEIRWTHESFLPLEADERNNTQRAFRKQYVEYLAGMQVDTTMTDLVRWFENQLRE